MLPKDYVRLRLTGEWAIDAADASGTLLFDVAHRRWSDEVLDALEIPAEWLPPVSESTEIAGAGDQQAAALGVGVIAAGHGLGRPRDLRRRPRRAPRVRARRHGSGPRVLPRAPGPWEAMGVMLNAAGALRWFRDAFAPGASFDELTAEAATLRRRRRRASLPPVPPGRADAARRSGRHGRRSPASRFATIAARSRAPCSRASPTGCGTRSSSCAELGVEPRAGRASGGGAHSRLWLEIVASALDLPLERCVVDEGSAYGAALLAGVADGTFASAQEAVAACVRVRETVEPNPAWAGRYADGYARYRALYPAIRGVEEQA